MDDHETPPHVKVVDRRWWAQQGASAETAGTGGAPADERPGKPTYVEDLERQLADKDRQLQETIARYRDSSREFDDARARLRKDVARDVDRAQRALLADLLDVLDNLDRALDAAARSGTADTLVQGVEMVRRLFLARLETHGVTRFDALGRRFDPALHDAISMVPTTDPSQDGIVCGVMTPGYLLRDEVLRPAAVAVGQLTGDSVSR